MGKGDKRRPEQISREEAEAAYERVFGKRPLNVMSDAEREEFERDRARLAEELERTENR